MLPSALISTVHYRYKESFWGDHDEAGRSGRKVAHRRRLDRAVRPLDCRQRLEVAGPLASHPELAVGGVRDHHGVVVAALVGKDKVF